MNYYCTTTPSFNATSLPTIWFESGPAHGIVDFLGLQTILARDYGRNACSYDPPSFGWSDPLPSKLTDYYSYFDPLLDALGRKEEHKVIVGWGGGAKNGLIHVLENPRYTSAFVLMDASPEGIEWRSVQNQKNWTEAQMLEYRSEDLENRVSLTKTILGLGIPWYAGVPGKKSLSWADGATGD